MTSIEQLLKKSVSELRKMSEKDVRAIMDRVRSAGNKRIKRAQKTGTISAKAQEKIDRGGLLTTKGKSKEELIDEFKRAKGITGGIASARKKKKEKEKRARTREREKVKRERTREREKEKQKRTQEQEKTKQKRERTRKKEPQPATEKKNNIDTKRYHNEITNKYSLDILLKKDKGSLDFVYDQLKKIVDEQIKILKENDVNPPALRAYEKRKEDEKPTDRNKMISEIQKMRKFLSDETSTLSGWRTVQDRIIKELDKKGITLDNNDFDEFFDIYEKIKELSPQVAQKEHKYNAFEQITENIENIKNGNISIEELKEKIYIEFIQSQQDNVNMSDFFPIDLGGDDE